MNKYLMRINSYFSGWDYFFIEAKIKRDSIIKAKVFCMNHPKYGIGGNYIIDSVECVKKVKKKL